MQPLNSKTDRIRDFWDLLFQGERSGLEGLYRASSRDLFQFGYSLVQDEDLVKDLIQELFIDLWKYHASLPATEKPKLYLFKCLSNKVAKAYKEDKRRLRILAESSLFSERELESAETKLIYLNRKEEVHQTLSRAMSKLPIRQKEVVNCLFFEKFTYEETSKVMEINLRSVYTLAWKAISSLKKTLLDAKI